MDNLLMDNLTVLTLNCPSDINADILRLDQLHPVISGNKWFKLKGHLQQASAVHPVITFGGAWSNHLIATACATQQKGIPSIGIVRGEKPPVLSATLTAAAAYGMQLEFISRREYAAKDEPAFLGRLTERYPGACIIPEGGAGITGIIGSEDILRVADTAGYTHILCAVGTGTMFLGLARAALPGQKVIGVPILKGMDGLDAIERTAIGRSPGHSAGPAAGLTATGHSSILSADQRARCRVLSGYHFGGYARHPRELIDFMNEFHRETGVPSDIVYTGKLFYAVRDSIRNNFFPGHSRLLIIHSGGLQGNQSLPPGTLNF
jgi:1-aminocyclopropane-1-carboxylate deaminase